MAAVDFITALGRMLHDGALRDAFVADAEAVVRQIGLRENDRPAFLRLDPAELECQARVLLRKRFELVRGALPATCRKVGDEAWREFERYGRSSAPTGSDPMVEDAAGFSEYLSTMDSDRVCRLELNRARFIQSQRRIAFHFIMVTPVNRTRRPGIQVLLSHASNRWREWTFYLSS